MTTSASQAMERNPKDKDMLQFPDRLPDAVLHPVDKTSWGPVGDRVRKTIGAAVDADPKQVLGTLQRFAAAQGGK